MRTDDIEFCVVIPSVGTRSELKTCIGALATQIAKPLTVVLVTPQAAQLDLSRLQECEVPLVHLQSKVGNQVEQRRIGVEYLLANYPTAWMVFLDDDIALAPTALLEVANLIRVSSRNLAAVCMRLDNEGEDKSEVSQRCRILRPTRREPGSVTRSGRNVAFHGAADGTSVEWVRGGTSVWRGQTLQEFQPPMFPCRYASMEDVIFSFPISKGFEFRYCRSAASVSVSSSTRSVGDFLPEVRISWIRTLHRGYLVWSNRDLSRLRYLGDLVGAILKGFLLGLVGLNIRKLAESIGTATGLVQVTYFGIVHHQGPDAFFRVGPGGFGSDSERLRTDRVR